MDNTKEYKKQVENILAQMTVEEKVLQMHQLSTSAISKDLLEQTKQKGDMGSFLFVSGKDIPEYIEASNKSRLKVPPIFGIDAIHGHSCLKGATVFPSQLAIACSFDEELIEEMGAVTAREVAADGQDWVFSPVLCVGRDLRWGRIDETFGEDSTLTARLGKAIIKGYQRDNLVAACAKHYLAYGEATGGRDAYDSSVTERKARELFLKPFKEAIDAGCMTVMTAYGSVDCEPLTVSYKWLTQILKEELDFEGFIVTDWQNINSLIRGQQVAENIEEACYLGIMAGNDMSMQVPEFPNTLIKLLKEGKISQARIDDAVRRILTVKAKLGLLEGKKERPDKSVIGCAEHQELNHKLALRSCVLLKNDGILPLKQDITRIAVIGPNADDIRAQYGDWTYFTHPIPNEQATPKEDCYSILRGIQEEFDGEVEYAKGVNITSTQDEQQLIESAVSISQHSDVIIAVLGDDVTLNGELKDRANLLLPGRQIELLKRLHALGKPIIVVLVNGKPLILNEIEQYASAIVETFNGGDMSGKAIAELLLGKENFSGKLPISIPYDCASLPCYYNQYSYWHGGKYIDVPTLSNYPFGYGLSYSKFTYSNLRVSKQTVSKEEEFILFVDITNVSGVNGDEIVQLYYKDKVCKILTPCRTLLDFKRLSIPAGNTVTVEFVVQPSALGYYNQNCEYCVDVGEFEFFISGDGKTFQTISVKVE